MIEKCSIGNMSYNIQNITLIILILILIIVIIYYLKNSSLKHDELIEKYTNISKRSVDFGWILVPTQKLNVRIEKANWLNYFWNSLIFVKENI